MSCQGPLPQTQQRLKEYPVRSPGSFNARVAVPVERFFARNKKNLIWVHVVMFLFFLVVIALPLFLPEPAETATAFNNFTRFANFAMWGLWFPLVFLSVIVTGRSWCGVLCPMGAAAEWANKKGLQRPIPAWLRWEGTPIVSFLIITVLGQTVGVRDHPEAAAGIFGGTMLVAILSGYLYGKNKRAWCRHACPIGLLLGVFSRIGAVQFAPKQHIAGGDRYTEKTPCPTMIDIPRKEESRHCIECFRCVSPQAKGGLFLQLRKPGEEVENIRDYNPNSYEVAFMFFGVGIALGGFLWLVLPQYDVLRSVIGSWFIEHDQFWIGESGPSWLMSVHPDRREVFNWLDFMMIVGTMLACMFVFALVLTLTTSLASWLSGKLGGDRNFRERFIELGYQYTPVAMVSLIIGLGGQLFDLLSLFNISASGIGLTKGGLFLLGLLWSVHLGNRILQRQGLDFPQRLIPLIPGVIGSLLVGLGWWPAIFGV
ncbi:ferredoxin [Cycloclasticus sp. 46_83_sub15_T18]|nr:ferredoxin [Cycloclasticus sp. 46_83_sub15_T18]